MSACIRFVVMLLYFTFYILLPTSDQLDIQCMYMLCMPVDRMSYKVEADRELVTHLVMLYTDVLFEIPLLTLKFGLGSVLVCINMNIYVTLY